MTVLEPDVDFWLCCLVSGDHRGAMTPVIAHRCAGTHPTACILRITARCVARAHSAGQQCPVRILGSLL